MSTATPPRRANPGLLARERTIAAPGFNRWLVPPAALCIHLCIGMAYGFSVFWKPLEGALRDADGKPVALCAAGAMDFADKFAGTLRALTATDCNWSQFDLGWMYTFFFVVLGGSAALWGGWLERVGPRKAAFVATLCWSGGLLFSALGVHLHQLWMLWLGAGLVGGIGLGLGYISPVSTLIKWFPDRRGLATGMAIMGFGGGAMIGSPLATALMGFFGSADSAGVRETFVALALIYFVFMLIGTFGYRIPAPGWTPAGWSPPATAGQMISTHHVHLRNAHRTPQFWLLWVLLCMNVSAGIGIIGAASPMLQETFGGALADASGLAWSAVRQDPALAAAAAGVAAGFVGLISLFNIFGRIGWASLSDLIGRRRTYTLFFVAGAMLYVGAALAAGHKSLLPFVVALCLIASMYGGGFATIPAYLADIFGTQFVAAIHGRLLTAWSVAGVLGPALVNYLHDTRVAAGVAGDAVYGPILYLMAAMLVVGLAANLLIRPVDARWHMSDAELATLRAAQGRAPGDAAAADRAEAAKFRLFAFWLVVLLPLGWGIWKTVQKALAMMQW